MPDTLQTPDRPFCRPVCTWQVNRPSPIRSGSRGSFFTFASSSIRSGYNLPCGCVGHAEIQDLTAIADIVFALEELVRNHESPRG